MCTLVGAALAWAPSPADAYASTTVDLVGHGWGHGRGMGQWGALGYAIGQDGGLGPQSYDWILGHYYAPATLGTDASYAGDAPTVRVAMVENDGLDVIVYGLGGTVSVPGGGSAPAVRFQQRTDGRWNVSTGADCAGGSAGWQPVAGGGPVTDPTTASTTGGTVQLCVAELGNGPIVHGSIEAVYNSSGAARSVNVVPLGQYLNGVVPAESPAGWGLLGGANPHDPGHDWGFQELEAQAVAARSYALSSPGGFGGYADTCDTTACQYYPGTLYETQLSDDAVTATAGQVMYLPGSAVPARTEYSSSTGGYTAGGTFDAVVDAGDAICVQYVVCNPNHSWQVQVPVSQVQAAWPAVGVLQAVDVTSRNGLGDFGGRAELVRVVGASGTVTVTGAAFAAALGLKSDWFFVQHQASGGVGGYWLAASDGGIFAFGGAGFFGSMGGRPLNEPVVGMAPTPDGQGYWLVASDGGIFAFGDAGFFGSMGGRPLNQPMVAMAATTGSSGYWTVASDGGIFAFGGADFFGSMGGRPLNEPVVGMAPTPDGQGYWLVASDGGIFAFGGAGFFGSMGGRPLNEPIVGMAATPDGQGYWLVASDGGIFAFGDAVFFGSTAGTPLGAGTSGVMSTRTGQGYLVFNRAGRVASFGDAPTFGDLSTVVAGYSGSVVAGAPSPS